MEKHLEIPLQKAIRFLEENGYRYAIIGGVALPPWGHVRATYDVDIKLAIPGYEELIIKRAVQRDLGGWSAWICSAEDLIIQKAIAGRGKDWLDIEALLKEQYGKLDEAYIEDWLSQFSEALENPDILREYQKLQKKIRDLAGE